MTAPSLVDAIARVDVLHHAWRRVEDTYDNISDPPAEIADLELHLDDRLTSIAHQLADRTWRPQPARVVALPKKQTGHRFLHIPAAVDRIVERALATLLSNEIDPDFHPASYGYRRGCSVNDAIKHVESLRDFGHEFAARTDVSSFFDNVSHTSILSAIADRFDDAHLTNLLAHILVRPVQTRSGLRHIKEGIAQGSPVSPLLANLVLDQLDLELSAQGVSFVRFADDITMTPNKDPDREFR
jgi:group II intron reverse transcriptase/maturase